MRKNEGRLVGILGTVIFHLIAALVFMSFQLHSIKKEISDDFVIEFAAVDEDQEEEQLIELPGSAIERILHGDEELLNIARNLANRPDVNIDPEDYIDKVKEELIKSGMLGEDNYIDEQKRLKEAGGDENLSMGSDQDKHTEEEVPDESDLMAANYQGPTRIYYDLEGRNHTYLPIPIYKCEGQGKVVLVIQVNQKGIVESAQVVASESTTTDQCLVETAVKSAVISRFNPDVNSPKVQQGRLTYHFVAQ